MTMSQGVSYFVQSLYILHAFKHVSPLFTFRSASLWLGNRKVWRVVLSLEHMWPMREATDADVINLEADQAGLSRRLHDSTLQSGDEVELVVVRAFKISDSFKSVPYRFLIPGLKHSPATLRRLMFAGYYVWNVHAKRLDSNAQSHANWQTSVKITSCMTGQPVQARAGDQ